MHSEGFSLSSSPAQVSINIPDSFLFTKVGSRYCRVRMIVRRVRLYGRMVAPFPWSYVSRLWVSQVPSRFCRRKVTFRSTYQLFDSTSVLSTSTTGLRDGKVRLQVA